jgi:hypothetical protein
MPMQAPAAKGARRRRVGERDREGSSHPRCGLRAGDIHQNANSASQFLLCCSCMCDHVRPDVFIVVSTIDSNDISLLHKTRDEVRFIGCLYPESHHNTPRTRDHVLVPTELPYLPGAATGRPAHPQEHLLQPKKPARPSPRLARRVLGPPRGSAKRDQAP